VYGATKVARASRKSPIKIGERVKPIQVDFDPIEFSNLLQFSQTRRREVHLMLDEKTNYL
jgi:hypothetical protein